MLAVVSEIIAESAWGVIGPPAEDGGALTWALAGDEVTDSPPPALSDATVGTDVGCACTYADFVKDVLFPRVPMAELEGGELKRALGENETRKRVRCCGTPRASSAPLSSHPALALQRTQR